MSADAAANAVAQLFGDTPALAPPPGETSNFVDPPSRAWLITLTLSVALPITTLFFLLRMYTKARINKGGLGLEDHLCWIGFISFVAFCGVVIVEKNNSAGIHQWNVPIHTAQEFTKVAIGLEVTYSFAICFAKLSLAVSYLKIFAPIRWAPVWTCIWLTILSNTGLYIATVLVVVLSCIPIQKLWEPWREGRCVNPAGVFIATSAVNIVIDFAMLILPLVCIWRLQMSAKRKRGISAILAFGIFACICSVLRFVSAVRFAASRDQTYNLVDQGLWATGEVASALISGAMLSVPQYVKAVFPRLATHLGTNPKNSANESRSRSISKGWPRHSANPHSPGLLTIDTIGKGEMYALEKPKDSLSDAERTAPHSPSWA